MHFILNVCMQVILFVRFNRHALLLLRLDSIRGKVSIEGEIALGAVLLLAVKHSLFDVVFVVFKDIVNNNGKLPNDIHF
jgi:hypothetical protein